MACALQPSAPVKIFFLVNGGRKPVPDAVLERFRKRLSRDSAQHRVQMSTNLQQARELVHLAAQEKFDTLWVGGGDGTIHVLLNQALDLNLAFGVVPMGTVNALARSLGIPLTPDAAIEHLLKAQPQPMDVGLVNGSQRFLCFASIGFDAAVVHDVRGAFKRYGGRVAYFLAGVAAILKMGRIAPFQVELHPGYLPVGDDAAAACPVDTETAQGLSLPDTGYSMMVSNISNYAGFPLFHGVQPCSGNMEFWLFRKRRLDSMLAWAAATGTRNRALQKRLEKSVGHYLVGGFTVRSEAPMFLQLDGEAVELADNREYRFECLPSAARVLV